MSRPRIWPFYVATSTAWILLVVAFPDIQWWQRLALGFAISLFVISHEFKDHAVDGKDGDAHES